MRSLDKSLTIFLLGLAHSLNHSFLLALPPLVPLIMIDLDISPGLIGLVAALAYFLYGAGSILGGLASDLFGEAAVISLSLSLSGLSTLIFLFIPGFQGLTFGLISVSIWASLYHPTANSFISKFYRERMANVMGLHGVGGNLGQMTVPAASVLIGLTCGWRFSFIFFGSLAIAASLYFLKLKPLRIDENPETEKKSIFSVFKSKKFRLLFLYNVWIGLMFRGTQLFFPTFLKEVKGFQVEASGFMLSLLIGMGVIGQIAGGRASDKYGSTKVLLTVTTTMLISFLFLYLTPEPLISAIIFSTLYGVAFYASQPAFNALIGKLSPEEIKGTVFGAMFLIVFSMGALSSMISGLIAEKLGIYYVFIFMGFLALASLFTAIKIYREKKVF